MSYASTQYDSSNPATLRADYDGNSLLIYFADAEAGTISSAAAWRIRKLTYDGNGNFVKLEYPNSDYSYSYSWDIRTTYTYA